MILNSRRNDFVSILHARKCRECYRRRAIRAAAERAQTAYRLVAALIGQSNVADGNIGAGRAHASARGLGGCDFDDDCARIAQAAVRQFHGVSVAFDDQRSYPRQAASTLHLSGSRGELPVGERKTDDERSSALFTGAEGLN